MRHRLRKTVRRFVGASALLSICAQSAALDSHQSAQPEPLTQNAVVARVYEHFGGAPPAPVLVVDSTLFPTTVWKRVKNLVAFRLFRLGPANTSIVDAAIYLVRDSALYSKAAAALRNNTTHHEYVWCLLAAVLAHEAAHTALRTERQALMAEAAQLRRCLFAGHLFSGDGWSPVTYLGKVEAKLRHPREHY